MLKNVKSFTISRAKWGVGGLLMPNGKMCCLGFLAKACGRENKDLYEAGYYPNNIPRDNFIDGLPPDVRKELGTINDVRGSPALKEEHIKGIFALHSIKVTFVP